MISLARFAMTILVAATVLLCALPAPAQDDLGPPGPPPEQGILWRRDLDEAIQLSRADGRPVIAYFTFDACVWCHKLEDDTFSDASVIEMSRAFHWVKINRDVTPEICERFNVSAYPSLITLGDKQEKVHRFSGYMLPDAFKPQLADALRRHGLYKAGKVWDEPEPRAERLCDDASVTIETFKAPSEEVPAGIAFLGDSMWVAQMGALFECDMQGNVKREFPLDHSVLDLCTDGANLYAMTSGWTAGQPIHVIDPSTGRTIRSIITEANKVNQSHGAKGIAFVAGSLYVLEGMTGVIHELDPQSGAVKRSIQTKERWITGLAHDGEHFITGSRDQLLFLDSAGNRAKAIAVHYPLRSVAWHAPESGPGAVYVMEQPVFDYGRQHEQIRLWPAEMRIYRLTIGEAAAAAPAQAALGTRGNPVRCDMPNGERAYLNRLRCADGSRPTFERAGSFGGGADGHMLDGYKVTCARGETIMIFMDMYHGGYVETNAVPGFTLVDP